MKLIYHSIICTLLHALELLSYLESIMFVFFSVVITFKLVENSNLKHL